MKKPVSFVLVLILLVSVMLAAACEQKKTTLDRDSIRVLEKVKLPDSLNDGKGMADSAQSVVKPPKLGESND